MPRGQHMAMAANAAYRAFFAPTPHGGRVLRSCARARRVAMAAARIRYFMVERMRFNETGGEVNGAIEEDSNLQESGG